MQGEQGVDTAYRIQDIQSTKAKPTVMNELGEISLGPFDLVVGTGYSARLAPAQRHPEHDRARAQRTSLAHISLQTQSQHSARRIKE